MVSIFGASTGDTAGERTRREGTLVFSELSWSAVIAGCLTSLVTQFVLNLLGLGIGLSTINAQSGQSPEVSTFSIGAGIWIIVSAILAFAAGGFVAGRLSGRPIRSTAGYHGLVTWALTTATILVLLTSAAGSLFGGALSTVTNVAGAAGASAGGAASSLVQGAKSVAPAILGTSDPLTQILDKAKSAANNPQNAAAVNDAFAAIKAAVSSDPAERGSANDKAEQALATATGTTPDQARAQIQDYETRYDQLVSKAKAEAKSFADAAATAASRGALVAAISLLVACAASFLGGRLGATGGTLRDA